MFDHPSAHDWNALEALAAKSDVLSERVTALKRRIDAASRRPGTPFTLLVGRPDAGLELLAKHWFGTEVAAQISRSGQQLLVVGAEPERIQPKLGSWPAFRLGQMGAGHFLLLCSNGSIPASTVAQIASIGYVEQAVLVISLLQPMHSSERELAAALTGIAATVRVLIVGLPGQEVTDHELAEVIAFAGAQMRKAGFNGGRCLGAGVWFYGANSTRPSTVSNLDEFFAVDEERSRAGRDALFRQSLKELFVHLAKDSGKSSPALPPISQEERERLTTELGGFLSDLGEDLERMQKIGRFQDSAAARTWAMDAVRGWGAYTTIPGQWLKYVERIRPGMQLALFEEVQSAFGDLEVHSVSELSAPAASTGLFEQVFVEAKRAGFGLLLGLAAYWAVTRFFWNGGNQMVAPGLLAQVVATLVLLIGGIFGYALGRKLFPKPVLTQTLIVPNNTPLPPGVSGWRQVKRRLEAWFAARMQATEEDTAERLRVLAERFKISLAEL